MEEVKTLEIDGKEYFLVDSIFNGKKTYYYFSNETDASDIYILTDKTENNQEYFVSIDTEKEYNNALVLFLENHKEDIEKTTKA